MICFKSQCTDFRKFGITFNNKFIIYKILLVDPIVDNVFENMVFMCFTILTILNNITPFVPKS